MHLLYSGPVDTYAAAHATLTRLGCNVELEGDTDRHGLPDWPEDAAAVARAATDRGDSEAADEWARIAAERDGVNVWWIQAQHDDIDAGAPVALQGWTLRMFWADPELPPEPTPDPVLAELLARIGRLEAR